MTPKTWIQISHNGKTLGPICQTAASIWHVLYPLVSTVEKICNTLAFSIFLANFTRKVESQQEGDVQDAVSHKEYELGPPYDTASKMLSHTTTPTSLLRTTRPNPFGFDDAESENTSVSILVLLLVPRMEIFLDYLLGELRMWSLCSITTRLWE
jgi:hypothetical protein